MSQKRNYLIRLGESEELFGSRSEATERARGLSDGGQTITVETADQSIRIQYRGGAMLSYDERSPSGRR